MASEKWYVIDNNDIGPEGDPARLGDFDNRAAAEIFKADYEVRNPGEYLEIVTGGELGRRVMAMLADSDEAEALYDEQERAG